MSIFSAVTAKTKLGGIFGLSSYLLLHEKLKSFVPADNPNKDTPIFMGHGDSDPLVLPAWGAKTAEVLKGEGFSVELKWYKGLQHSANPEEIDDLETYLQGRIPPAGETVSR